MVLAKSVLTVPERGLDQIHSHDDKQLLSKVVHAQTGGLLEELQHLLYLIPNPARGRLKGIVCVA